MNYVVPWHEYERCAFGGQEAGGEPADGAAAGHPAAAAARGPVSGVRCFLLFLYRHRIQVNQTPMLLVQIFYPPVKLYRMLLGIGYRRDGLDADAFFFLNNFLPSFRGNSC